MVMILGILGGMGPLATCELFKRIIKLTNAKDDQDHMHIIIDNNTRIPDRTRYILGEGKDPRTELIRSAIRLENMGADYIAMPCNTAHYFYDDIVKFTTVNILDMINETVKFLKQNNPKGKKYLLLATEGTYKTKIYQKYFDPVGLEMLIPNDDDKRTIMEWIYGIKSSRLNTNHEEVESLIEKHIKGEDIPVIVGCTELSILVENIMLSKKYFDPMTILAMRCVKLHKGIK